MPKRSPSQYKILRGESLSSADIRGRKFTNLILEDISFSNIKVGLPKYAAILLLILSLLSQLIAGGIAAQAGELIFSAWRFQSQLTTKLISTPVFLGFLLVFLFVTAKKGFATGLITGVGAAIGSLLLVLGFTKNFSLTTYLFFFGTGSLTLVAISLLAITLGMIVFRALRQTLFASISATLLLPWVGSMSVMKVESSLVAVVIAFFSIHLAYKALAGQQTFKWIFDIAVAISAIGGTSFQDSYLIDIDFSNTDLRNTNFRNAALKGINWRNSVGLDFAHLGGTYLQSSQIRQLVITGNGQSQDFSSLALDGINLQSANLQGVIFAGASLNQANLRGADLSRAILKQTQLEGADLTGAILTGAYIEDWGITGTTKLENVQCEYVYMRVPTQENPNPLRKPDNLRETFAEGEFADFIQPFFDTLDLYHSQDVDPRAISIALRDLSANHPSDRLQFVAIERRGNHGINLRFTTAPRTNKSELSHEYFTNYAQIKKELPVAVQMQLAEQDAEIRTLKGTIEQFIQTGTHRSTLRADTIQVIQGEIVVTENRGININTGNNANISGLNSGDGIVNLGSISGNVTNAINHLPESESDQPTLKELLSQLQQAIQDDVDLLDPDKSDLLEQVQSLAEAKQTEEPKKREGITRKAMKIFDATLKSLPETAKITEACSKLLPLILKALGVPA